jgi:cysteine desulfurase/selenocysteine lyase
MIDKAHEVGAAVLIDGAQFHLKPDMQALDCDFYVFSGHKICGPTGIGILYGKEEWLNKLPPYQGGGEMIKEFRKTTYAELPHKFEAGTPNIAAGIVLPLLTI